MPTPLAALLFTGSLATTLVAARLFARRLDRLGVRFRFPEALVGLLTALAADGPEISSALFALLSGAHATGVGVVVGSNAFNLAAMIGVSALLVGSVTVRRRTLVLEGCVGVGMTLDAVAVLLHWISPIVAAATAAIVIVPYLGLVLGVLILAPITSLPNAITAIRLGLANRGGALVAETLNSNTINLVAGVIAP